MNIVARHSSNLVPFYLFYNVKKHGFYKQKYFFTLTFFEQKIAGVFSSQCKNDLCLLLFILLIKQ